MNPIGQKCLEEKHPKDHAAILKVVTDAITNAFPKDAAVILEELRYHPGDDLFSFNRWGMFVGVELDGHIHT